jgi:hypothetical protein
VRNGEPALAAREDEQRADESLGMIHRGADVRRHAAQLMRGVGDEPLLGLERGLEPAQRLG